MLKINSTTAKKLILESDYEGIYTEEVCSNGGNSAKISCKKEFIGREVIIFVLKKEFGGNNGK